MSQQSYSWAYTQRKPLFKKIYASQSLQQHYLQQPGHASNLNVHQQRKGQRRCIAYIQWNIQFSSVAQSYLALQL